MNSNLIISIIILIIIIIVVFVILFIFLKNTIFLKRNILYKNNKFSLIEAKQTAYIITDALKALSKRKIGAIIIIKKNDALDYYESIGVPLNADITEMILLSIFQKSSPLHDGAIIIKGKKILCASTYLPTTRKKIAVKYGSRHRAAIGLTEQTDAICVVVSETDGKISISKNGRLSSVTNNSNLLNVIVNMLK